MIRRKSPYLKKIKMKKRRQNDKNMKEHGKEDTSMRMLSRRKKEKKCKRF